MLKHQASNGGGEKGGCTATALCQLLIEGFGKIGKATDCGAGTESRYGIDKGLDGVYVCVAGMVPLIGASGALLHVQQSVYRFVWVVAGSLHGCGHMARGLPLETMIIS